MVVLACFFYSPSSAHAQENATGSDYIESGNLIDNSQWSGALYAQDPNNCCHNPAGSGAIYDTNTDTIKFSYGRDTVQNIISLQQALGATGVTINGYNWSMDYRMMDNNGRINDSLYVDIILKDTIGYVADTQRWDMSNWQSNEWTRGSGAKYWGDEGVPDIDTIIFSLEGKDGGFWAGLYGPEVKDIEFNITYGSDPCASNPLSDPTCEGYQEAYYDQQCSYDPLYDSQCMGYEQAYFTQQCSYDALYDSECFGYEEAYYTQQCSIDALYDTDCPGYEQAYYNQQCSYDALYDPTCSGYEEAYYTQQCSLDALYDTGCPGYEQAYYNYQCSLDSLYDTGCEGYAITFQAQQCSLDPQYSPTCPGYTFPTVVSSEPEPSQNTGQPSLEESMGITEQIVEIQPEIAPIVEEIPQEALVEEKKEEEIVELPIITEESVKEEQKTEKSSSNNRNQAAIASSLEQTAALLDNIIGSSISSGTSESNMAGSDGGFYSDDAGTMGGLTTSDQEFSDFVNTSSNDTQDSQNLNDSIALGGAVNTGVSIIAPDNKQEPKEERKQTLAEKMAEKIRKKNADDQEGIFGKQESVLDDIASATDLNKYYDERLADAGDWYGSGQIYNGNRLPDKGNSYYRMNSKSYGTMRELIRSQY